MPPTLAIFPAAGALGTSLTRHLLETVKYPPSAMILVNRNPLKTPAAFVDGGALVRGASYESTPDELEAAFAGADALFLISYPDYNKDYRVKVQLKALDAAIAAGVKHIFYSSLAFAGEKAASSAAVVMQAHLVTENRLEELVGSQELKSFTSIREGIYSESFPMYTGFLDLAANQPMIRHPHNGRPPGIAWAKRDELGEGSARIVQRWAVDEHAFANQVVLLSGPRAWTLHETAQLLERLTGRSIPQEEISVLDYVKQPQVRGVLGEDEERLRWWSTSYDGIRDGECAHVSHLLADLLEREPEDFEKTVSAMLQSNLGTYKHKQTSE